MLCACRSPKMEEVSYSTACPDSVNEAMRCLLAAPRLHTLELTPRNMTLTPENMHIIGALPYPCSAPSISTPTETVHNVCTPPCSRALGMSLARVEVLLGCFAPPEGSR